MSFACTRCAQSGPVAQRICPACGQIQPRGDGLRRLESHCDANLYLIEDRPLDSLLNAPQDTPLDAPLALWESREHLSEARRARVFEAFQQGEPVPGLLPVLDYRITAVEGQGRLLELIQPGAVYAGGQDLESLIRAQGLPDPALTQRWIGQLLLALQALEARGICLNAVASPLIRICQGQAWLSQLAWADLLEGEARPAARLLRGFTPPEAARRAVLLPESDRFGLAMVLFHLLTGLSPALWAPDLPRLRSYQSLWGKPVLAFFEALLAPVASQPIAELVAAWDDLELRLRPDQLSRIQAENQAFYAAVEAAAAIGCPQADAPASAAAAGLALEATALLARIQGLTSSLLHNPHSLRLIGDLHWLAGQGEAAVSAYSESLRRESLGSTWLQLGRFYLRSGAGEHAEAAFREACARLPHEPEGFWRLGQIALASGRTAQAGRWLKRSLEVQPTRKARELLARLELAARAGSGGVRTPGGFVYRSEGWDQAFAQRFQAYVCPAGHVQAREASDCAECQRPMHYLPGERLLAYRIESALSLRDLGKRHRSSTYAARDPQGQRVLIKEITPDTAGRERCAREAAALQTLAGLAPGLEPAIPRLLAQFEHGGRLYLVQSWQPGQDLEQLVRAEGPLAEAEVREILEQGLKLIELLAWADLAHGDIKPKNLLWDAASRRLSLIDFDVCVPLGQKGLAASPGWTEHYAAPEQRRRQLVSRRSDAFSLGLSALWLLTGLSPELYLSYLPSPAYRHWRQDAPVGTALYDFISRLLRIEYGPDQEPAALRQAWPQVMASQVRLTVEPAQASLIQAWYRLHAEPEAAVLQAGLPDLLARRPDARLRYLVGHELIGRGLDAAALPQLRSALVLDPHSPYAYLDLAGLHVRRGQWAQARELLSQALEQAGPLPAIYLALARCQRHLNEPRQALASLAQARRQGLPDLELLLEEARNLIGLESYAAARSCCEQALQLQPESAAAYQLLGSLAALQQAPEQALRWGRRAAELEPQDPRLHYDLGLSCYRFNRFDEAVASLLRALALAPSLWQASYYLGSAELMRGHLREAEAALREALAGASQSHRKLIQTKLEIVRRGLSQQAA